jgi:Ser/Thr protein kinase RdoA (MazF antagonist)
MNALELRLPQEMNELDQFFTLTPDAVLSAVEEIGSETTGLCYALNSLENRVFEVELEDRTRLVAKFYRPGRWSRETILDEHRALSALVDNEITVIAPLAFGDGSTLHTTADGINFTLFPRRGGRAPDDIGTEEAEQLGRMLGRIHNALASLALPHRPELSPKTYGTESLEIILARATLSPGVRGRYETSVRSLIERITPMFASVPTLPVHADFHRGNVLRATQGWLVLDFDDMARGPAVQDFWLMLPGRPADVPRELEAMLGGYEQFRELDRKNLDLVEPLRALRYVRYAAWIAQRWDDPAFKRAFPDWGTDRYWEQQLADINEQLALID